MSSTAIQCFRRSNSEGLRKVMFHEYTDVIYDAPEFEPRKHSYKKGTIVKVNSSDADEDGGVLALRIS